MAQSSQNFNTIMFNYVKHVHIHEYLKLYVIETPFKIHVLTDDSYIIHMFVTINRRHVNSTLSSFK